MKYLKRYNESIDKVDTCIELTGYTFDQLKNIFQLNLEDNGEFEVLDVHGWLLPCDNEFDTDQRKIVSIELTEDFGEEFSYSPLRQYARGAQEYYITTTSKKLLDVIAKKYDLKIGKVELRGMLGNNEFRVSFRVEKNNTTA